MKYILLFFFSCIYLIASDYKIVTQHFPPYQIYSDNKLSGISVDIIQELQKRSNQTFPIEIVNSRKEYNKAQSSKGSIIFSLNKTPKRDQRFQWVGPVTTLQFVFFQKAKDPLKITQLEDARKAKAIIVTKNDLAHRVLLRLDFTNLIVLPNNASDKNIRTLAKLDKDILWAEDYRSGLYRIKELGLSNRIIATMTKNPITQVELNIAFHKDVDEKILVRWQQLLQEIKADGTYEKIVKRYVQNGSR